MLSIGLFITLVGASVPGPAAAAPSPGTSKSRWVAHAPNPAPRVVVPKKPQRISVFLKRKALKVKGDKVMFRPGLRARRAKYYAYRFDKKEFLSKVGPIASVKTRLIYCDVRSKVIKKHQIPVGTITTVTYNCGITLFGNILPLIRQRKNSRKPQVFDVKNIILNLPRDNRFLLSPKAVGRQAYYRATKPGKKFRWKGKDYVRFNLVSTRVRASTYIALIIPADEFKKQVGPVAYKKLLLRVRIKDVHKKVWQPKNKKIPAPQGGFHYYTITASIIQAMVK